MAMTKFLVVVAFLACTGHAQGQKAALAELLLGVNPNAAFNPTLTRSSFASAKGPNSRRHQQPVSVTDQELSDMMIDAYEKELPGFRHYLENGMAKEVVLDGEFFNISVDGMTVAQMAENSGLSTSSVEKLMKMLSPEAEQKIDQQVNAKLKPVEDAMEKALAELDGMDIYSEEYKKKYSEVMKPFDAVLAAVEKIDLEEQKEILDIIQPVVQEQAKDYKGPPIKLVPDTLELEEEDPADTLKQFAIDDTVFDNMPAEAAKILDAYDGDKPKETLEEFLKVFDPFAVASA